MIVRRMTATDALALLLDPPPQGGLSAQQWEAIRQRLGLLAFTAAEGELLVGFVIAKSHPALVHVVHLEGSTEACQSLLLRLTRAAGKRDLSVWCPLAHTDLRDVLESSGFILRDQGQCRGQPASLYVRETTDEEL